MTQYLLGELSQPEQTALEERYFSDSGLFVQLLETENDLIDDYARGHLSATLRRRFEQHYLAHPKRRARLRFGEALIARLDDIEQSSSTPAARMSGWDQLLAGFRGSTPARVFSMTLAVSLIVVAG
ncbi:MAG TPA: hypothetical protein VI750_07440, partial [Pyrinomonadaceae bacterium]|nr:hypothetical protein [Pyrinomonadaceae bacterium]